MSINRRGSCSGASDRSSPASVGPLRRPIAQLEFSAGTLLLRFVWRDELLRLFGKSQRGPPPDGIPISPAWNPPERVLRSGKPQANKRVVDFWTWDARVSGWRCDARHYPWVREQLWSLGRTFDDHVPQWRTVRWDPQRQVELRAAQQSAIRCWWQTKQGCVVMPTGTGKTEVALELMAQTGVSTLVVAPVRDLMYQWHRRIAAALGYEAGLIGDRRYAVRSVSVTTYESACIHMERLGNRFKLIVFDECHHLPGPVRQDAARMSAAPWRLGLTATPPADHQERAVLLAGLIGPVIYQLPFEEARDTTLAPYLVKRIGVQLSGPERRRYDRLSRTLRQFMAERRRADPNYSWQDVCGESVTSAEACRMVRTYHAKAAIEHQAVEKLRVVEDLFRLHLGESCIVFAGSNAMARDVARRFLIPCITSQCGKDERREILDGLETGVYPAVVANRVLDEGMDVPDVKLAIVLGGTASTRQAQQRLGRVLRKAGNRLAWLYEVVCEETKEPSRSHRRRSSDAYQTSRHHSL